jgi:hypothetical protein
MYKDVRDCKYSTTLARTLYADTVVGSNQSDLIGKLTFLPLTFNVRAGPIDVEGPSPKPLSPQCLAFPVTKPPTQFKLAPD